MRLELLLYLAVAALFGYFLMGYVKKSEGSGDASVFSQHASIKEDKKSYQKDSVGQKILDFTHTPKEKQPDVWKRSSLHQEFMELFPNFVAMRDFVQDRIIGDSFQTLLLKQIDATEDDFFSGKITKRVALERLDSL